MEEKIEQVEKKININATSGKRIGAFTIDVFFSNFFRMLLLQILVFTETHISNFNNFKVEFNNLFGSISYGEIKDYHIRYFVNSNVFGYFAEGLWLFCFAGALYNFLCYLFFNGTLGQKIISLKLVNLKNENNANVFKKLLKAILVPLPFILVFILFSFTFLYLIQFHIYAPVENNFSALIITKLTSISNIFSAILVAVFFALFWYGFYFLNSKNLLLGDIMSGTRVIDKRKKYNIDLILNNKKNESDGDFVSFMDRVLSYLEKFNIYLRNKLNALSKKLKK